MCIYEVETDKLVGCNTLIIINVITGGISE